MSVKWREAAIIVAFPALIVLGILIHQLKLDKAARRRQRIAELDEDEVGCYTGEDE